jgi:hypothetical protein
LFGIANFARHLKLDPKAALRAANRKFARRSKCIEETLAAKGKTPKQSSFEEMDGLWNQAKAEEREQLASAALGRPTHFRSKRGSAQNRQDQKKSRPRAALQ